MQDTADDSATGRSCELDLFWLPVHCYSAASSTVAARKGLLGPCAKLYFPCNPIAETDQAILAGDRVGTARTGHAGAWPRIGRAESRQPHDCSHIPSSPERSHCRELANPNTVGIRASDESTLTLPMLLTQHLKIAGITKAEVRPRLVWDE